MMATVRLWVQSIPAEKQQRIMYGLTREGVRNGSNHDNEVTQKVDAQISFSQKTVIPQSQSSRTIQDSMSSVVHTSIASQPPTVDQSPSFASTQQLFTVQSPQQSVMFKHDQMSNPQLPAWKLMETTQAPTPQPTVVVSRSIVPDQAPPAVQVPTSVPFKHDQRSNPGLGPMFIRPAPPPPPPVVITRDIQPEPTPPVIQIEPPPIEIPQSLDFHHDQMSNPGHFAREPLSAQTGALTQVTNTLSTVGFSATRSATSAVDYRSTTIAAEFSAQARLPVIRPHNLHDYSAIYEMAKMYTASNYSLEAGLLAQRQDVSYDGADGYDENAGEGTSEGFRPILRMWPYNTSQYKKVGDQNYGNQGYSYQNQGYNPTSYGGDSYTGGQGQVYGNSESTRIQESFQSLSIKEVPLSFVS